MHPRAWPAVVSICMATVALLAPSALSQTPPPPSPEKPAWASAPAAEEPPICVKCHKGAWEGFSLTKHAQQPLQKVNFLGVSYYYRFH